MNDDQLKYSKHELLTMSNGFWNDKKRLNIVNTRKMYDGIVHGHVSVGQENGLTLLVVGCRDGKFFLEAENEGEFSNENGISYPFVPEDEYLPPHFFESKADAENRAVELLSTMMSEDSQNV